MNKPIRNKLFLMMVLEFFIWGAWLPLIFGYLPSLNFTPGEQAWILNAFPIAAIVGMFFSNQFADRNFAAEKFLAASHLIAGLAIIGLFWVPGHEVLGVNPDGTKIVAAYDLKSFLPFFGLMMVHCLLYVPTISITNSIAFANMKDAQKEFGIVRMGGTVGWILAAWPFVFILVDWAKVPAFGSVGLKDWFGTVLASGLSGAPLQDATKWTYIVAGIASLVLALFSLTLPHTPPKKASEAGGEKLAWLEAVKLLKHPFILVLWLVTLVDAFVHNCYFSWTGRFLALAQDQGGVGIPGNWVTPIMSIGQIAEILTMFILGATLKKLGWRWTMVVGVLGHAGRFAVYAFFPDHPGLIIAIQILHGICYAFFFATVYIFVDEFFPKDARTSAQGLFNVMILGIGALAAYSVCPKLFEKFTATATGRTDFHSLFLVPMACASAAALAIALFFRPPAKAQPAAGGIAAPPH